VIFCCISGSAITGADISVATHPGADTVYIDAVSREFVESPLTMLMMAPLVGA